MSLQSIHAFAEKVALISDGASRVGKAVALQLALQGCFVIVGYTGNSAADESAIEELKSLGTLADGVKTDVSTKAGAKTLVGAVNTAYGRLDLLVNCANSLPEDSFEDVTEESFDQTLGSNARAAFFVTQAALELMKDRPKPRIVNVVSACDTPETSGNTAFSMAQAAVIRFTTSLAGTLPQNYRVNCVAVSEKKKNGAASGTDLFQVDKGVSADDVARAVVFLLSGEAVGLNGQILAVE